MSTNLFQTTKPRVSFRKNSPSTWVLERLFSSCTQLKKAFAHCDKWPASFSSNVRHSVLKTSSGNLSIAWLAWPGLFRVDAVIQPNGNHRPQCTNDYVAVCIVV